MNHTIKYAFAALFLSSAFFSTPAFADEAEVMEKPSFSASQSVQMTAVVEAINMETREVVVKGADGE